MNRRRIITFIVLAALLVVVIVGAETLYDYLREEAPADMPLTPPVQSGGTDNSPSPNDQGDSGENATADEQEGSGENAAADVQDDKRTPAPDFIVQDIDGNDVKLSDMLGRPVVLNFWASWCPPCRAEMPEFDQLYGELGEKVSFMMVCVVDGSRETRESGWAFIEENGYVFPVFFDTRQEAAMQYRIRSIPTTLFIDADGYVVTWAEGAISEETLRLGISYIMN